MRSFALALTLAMPFAGEALSTKYDTSRALRVEIESNIRVETTSMEVEQDGTPVDIPGGGRGGSETNRKEIHVDRVVEVDGAKPAKVRRKFVKVGGDSSFERRGETQEMELESPYEGLVVELERSKDGGVDATVVEGTAPDDEKGLALQRLDSFLDGLLSKEEVAVDATWDLEKDAIARALRLDVQAAMFPPPERSDAGGGGDGERPRNRGPRGGREGAMLAKADWKGTAKLSKLDEDVEGVACAVIEIEIEASGEMEPPRAFGGRRDRAFEPAADSSANYEVKLTGKLHFATKEHRPVKLELEGKLRMESRLEMTSDRGSMKTHSVQEGKIEYTVEVGLEKVEEKSEKK